MLIRLIVAAAIAAGLVAPALAAPSRIVILRHGEKADDWKLCEIGKQRAQALRLNYLGKDAAKSLFTEDAPPAYFFAITLHTAELATPAVDSWGKPLIFYSVFPDDDAKKMTEALNERTQEAARNILVNPALKGKTIVMVWEHKHIANKELDAKYQREAAVTLRQLFHLDILPGVPRDMAGRDLRLFLDRRLPRQLERAVQVHHGEAGVRQVVSPACRPMIGASPTASTPRQAAW